MLLTSSKNWKTVRLGEISEIIDGDRGVNYPKNEEFLKKGFCLFLSTKNVPNTKFEFSAPLFISEEVDFRLRKGKLQREDFVLTTRGTIGNIAFYSKDIPYDHIRINSGMVILRPIKDLIDSKFFILYLTSPEFHSQVLSLQSGSAQPQLPIKDLKNFEISLPEFITEQKEIAEILGCLDDKIELLRRENKTLESIAQTLFKEWFVNFNFPGSNEKMVDSELGEIPEGWKVGKLGEIAFVTKGTTPTTIGGKFTETGINFIKAESITEEHGFNLNKIAFIDEHTNNLLNRSVIQADDLLYTIAGTIGRFALIKKDLVPANTNQAVAIIRANKDIVDPYYLRCYFDLDSTKESLTGSIVEAVQANLSLGSIKDSNVLIPNNICMELFIEKIKPVFLKADLHNLEIKTLSKLRDDLLNKIFNE